MGENKSAVFGGDRALDEVVREVVAEQFADDVDVMVYDNRGKLDVHVTPRGAIEDIEAELGGIDAVQYSDLKFTIDATEL